MSKSSKKFSARVVPISQKALKILWNLEAFQEIWTTLVLSSKCRAFHIFKKKPLRFWRKNCNFPNFFANITKEITKKSKESEKIRDFCHISRDFRNECEMSKFQHFFATTITRTHEMPTHFNISVVSKKDLEKKVKISPLFCHYNLKNPWTPDIFQWISGFQTNHRAKFRSENREITE